MSLTVFGYFQLVGEGKREKKCGLLEESGASRVRISVEILTVKKTQRRRNVARIDVNSSLEEEIRPRRLGQGRLLESLATQVPLWDPFVFRPIFFTATVGRCNCFQWSFVRTSTTTSEQSMWSNYFLLYCLLDSGASWECVVMHLCEGWPKPGEISDLFGLDFPLITWKLFVPRTMFTRQKKADEIFLKRIISSAFIFIRSWATEFLGSV